MNHEEFSLLMTRKLSGEATEEELNELEGMMRYSKELEARHNFMLQYWNNHENGNESDVESSLKKVLSRIEKPVVAIPKNSVHKIWYRVAAACGVIILAGAGVLFFFNSKPVVTKAVAKVDIVEKSNSKGTKSVLELSDGSKIWLNADSKLKYPQVFTGNSREVYLNGEAFFDVARNPSKPFIIHLSNGTVRVLGTSFNVRAYDNENKIETSVATGKVAFIPKYQDAKKKRDTLFLTPDRKLEYVYAAEELIIRPTSGLEDKAWTEGRLIFKSMSWEQIAIELERNFGKKIIFENEAIKQYRLTGYFQNNSLEEILYYLSKTSDFGYEVGSENVRIFYLSNNRS